MAPSSPQLASREPSGLRLSDWIVPWCAFRTRTHSPCCKSHQRSIPSLLPLSSSVPLGFQANACTTAFGSLKVYRHSPLRASQMKSSPLPLLPPPGPGAFAVSQGACRRRSATGTRCHPRRSWPGVSRPDSTPLDVSWPGRLYDRPTGTYLLSPPILAPPAESSQWPETFHL